ncbi:hypothetical protein JCM19241_3209 [Vibrio ishigakensis]|uniref:Alkaline phosphatase n=1 Tax=Vibrio ishigakensis TaxID=1481914 RepID=A0A0B8QE61_9VIBR|nr:hypothetical protein JCM19241_3209 [Vibrio ishigakensis]
MQKMIGAKAPLAILVTSLLLLGCDDSESSSPETSLVTAPDPEAEMASGTQISFDFPQANSNLAGMREFTFYGPVANEAGGVFDESVVEKIELKHGEDSTLGSYSNGEFLVTAPMSVGEGEYTLVATFTDGSVAEQSISLSNTSLLHYPIALEIDETNNRVFVFEDNAKEIQIFDLESGYGQLLSGSGSGSGVWVEEAGDMYYHSATDTLYLVDEDADAVTQINVATGERTRITDDDIDPSNPLSRPEGIAYLDANTLLVAESSSDHGVYSVDIDTGLKQQISTDNAGNGDFFAGARKLFISQDNTHVFVADDSEDRLVKVELSSGDRTVISGYHGGEALVGSGEEFQSAEGLAYDTTRDKALIADDSQDKLFSVDLISGDRTVLLDKATGGALIDDITDVDYHVGEQSAYILDKELDSIVAFDMNTSQVESLLKGNGDDFSTVDHSGIEAIKVEFDALNNRVIVLTEDALYSIDSLGNRVELSGSSVGVGEEINSFDAMAFDEASQRVWVGKDNSIVEVDLTSGDRTLITSNTIDGDLVLDRITALHFNGTALVVGDEGASDRNSEGDQIVFVDIETGKKTLISDENSAGDAVLYKVTQLFQYEETLYGMTGFRPVEDRLFQVDLATGEKNYISIDSVPVDLDTVEDIAYDKYSNRILVINDELVLSIDQSLKPQNLFLDFTKMSKDIRR